MKVLLLLVSRLLNLGDGGWPHEKAVLWLAVEVALALDAAIVLPGLLVQLNAHPLTGRELRGTNKLHCPTQLRLGDRHPVARSKCPSHGQS